MLPPSPRYSGYRSFDYLEPGRDYREFKLAPELGRVPAQRRELSEAQRQRADRLLADSVVISLHDHPTIFPDDITSSFELGGIGWCGIPHSRPGPLLCIALSLLDNRSILAGWGTNSKHDRSACRL